MSRGFWDVPWCQSLNFKFSNDISRGAIIKTHRRALKENTGKRQRLGYREKTMNYN